VVRIPQVSALPGQYINITVIIYEFEWIRFVLQNKLRSVFPCNNLVEMVKRKFHIDLRAFVGQLQQHHCPLKINLSHMLLNVCHHFFPRL
jgi:hypothetical protein